MGGMRSQHFELALVFFKSVLLFLFFDFRGVNLILYFSNIIFIKKNLYERFELKHPKGKLCKSFQMKKKKTEGDFAKYLC